MIPPDVASRLRLITQDQPPLPQALLPAKQLTDVLTNLVPGQRLMAEIKMLLPNGTYRAVVSQRDVTLALPFAAKSGDSLELEVLESNGKLSLAVVTNKTPGNSPGTPADSVPTRLSNTGQLIGSLLTGIDAEGKRARPAALNNNQPIVDKMPRNAAELIPVLKEALTKSGMFFESHQARWVEGKVSTASLLEQPQGKLSPGLPPEPGRPANHTTQPNLPPAMANNAEKPPAVIPGREAAAAMSIDKAPPAAVKQGAIPSELTPIVQQQLDALSTQNYLWQGQLTPGVEMQWEISEEEVEEREADGDGDSEKRWTTSLRLTLPNLGGITATLSLRATTELEISLKAKPDTLRQLRSDSDTLVADLQAAGLKLNAFEFSDGEPD